MPDLEESAKGESGGCESGCELIHVFFGRCNCSISFFRVIFESWDKVLNFNFLFVHSNRQVDK